MAREQKVRKLIKTVLTTSIIVTCFIINGCLFPWVNLENKSIQDQAVDDIFHVANSYQRQYLRRLTNPDDIKEYIDNFWKEHDPTPNTAENEFRQTYEQRLQFANDNFFETPYPGCRSDRGRILILYGFPDEVEEEPIFMDYMPDSTYHDDLFRTEVKSVITWRYYEPENQAFTREFTGQTFTHMYFEFGDMTGCGRYYLIYSSIPDEPYDMRPWQ